MKKLLIGMGLALIVATGAARASDSEIQSIAMDLSPAPGWTKVHPAFPGDDKLEVSSTHHGGSADLSLWEEDEPYRSLRGVWTSERYSVVIEKGGAILRDARVPFAGVPGCELIYRIRSGGTTHYYLDAAVIKDRVLFTAHCVLADQSYKAYAAEVEQMLASSRFIVAPRARPSESVTPQPTPEAKP